MENTTTMHSNFDDNFNIDLPAEIEDLHDENTEWERVTLQLEDQERWDNDELLDDPDNEPLDDPDVYTLDDPSEDDSWDDADTFTSIGWGIDEDYGLFEEQENW